jgi:hypothetical protein
MIGLPIVISSLYVSRARYNDVGYSQDVLLLINVIYVLFGLGTFISMMVFWSQANSHKYLLIQHKEGNSFNYTNSGLNVTNQGHGDYMPPVTSPNPMQYNSGHQSTPVSAQSYPPPLPKPVIPTSDTLRTDLFENKKGRDEFVEEKAKSTNSPIKNEENSVEKLKKYHDLLNMGLITQADFDSIKKEILNNK